MCQRSATFNAAVHCSLSNERFSRLKRPRLVWLFVVGGLQFAVCGLRCNVMRDGNLEARLVGVVDVLGDIGGLRHVMAAMLQTSH